jgi:formylglycine-generating enzyme required for sulfatase activity
LECVHPGVAESCADGWCKIPAGCFVIGSPEGEIGRAAIQEEQAAVSLTHNFEIQQTEVTLGEWEQAGLFDFPNVKIGLDGSGPCTEPQCPVKNATWYQALQHANWLSQQRGLASCYRVYECDELSEGFCMVEILAETVYECEGYRLPTSAEWEYAARAGTTTAFYSGPIASFERNDWCNWDPNLVRVAWYCANVPTMQEQPVAQLLPNAWGLYDALGNVDEWAWDRARGLPMPNPSTDPEGTLSHSGGAVTRSCQVNGTHDFCRAADHLLGLRDKPDAGFRLVRTLGKGTLPTIDDVPEEYRNGWDVVDPE